MQNQHIQILRLESTDPVAIIGYLGLLSTLTTKWSCASNFYMLLPVCKSHTRTVLSSEQLTKYFSKCTLNPRTQLSCSRIFNIKSPFRESQILIERSREPETRNSVSLWTGACWIHWIHSITLSCAAII